MTSVARMLIQHICQFIVVCNILLAYLSGITAVKEPLLAVMFDVKCHNYDRALIKSFNCSLIPDHNGLPMWSLNFTTTQNVDNLEFRYKFLVDRLHKYRNIFSTHIDFCHEWTTMSSHMVLRFLAKETKRVSNLRCPLKMNQRYYIDNFNNSAFELPGYIPELKYMGISDFYVNSKRVCMIQFLGKIMRLTKENIKHLRNELKCENFP